MQYGRRNSRLDTGNEIILTLSAGSKEEVNNWEDEVKEAGVSFSPRQRNLEQAIMVLFFRSGWATNSTCFIYKADTEVIA